MLSSKYLAYLLRHHPEKEGLTLDNEGWCSVQKLLEALNISMAELEEVVNNNTRFIFSLDKSKIKAAHGHSVKVEYSNEEEPPEVLYHGTAFKLTDVILAEGLKSMTREMVHLSRSPLDAEFIGERHTGGKEDKVIIFVIDALQMYRDGYKFHKSEDNVWLTKEVPAKYIKKPEVTIDELRAEADKRDVAGYHMEVICDYPEGDTLALRLHDIPNTYYLEDDDDDFPDRFWSLFVDIDLKTKRITWGFPYVNYKVIMTDEDIEGLDREDPYEIFRADDEE